MIAANPQGRPANEKGYIGALAATLMEYPKAVALRCADPVHGVSRETKFLPTVADIVAWCERETAAMRGPVEREDRDAHIRRQMAERASGDARLNADRPHRPTLRQMQDKHGPNWGIGGSSKAIGPDVRTSGEDMRRANQTLYERECTAAGIDPAGGVSPYLRRLLAATPMAPPEAAE